LVLVVEDDDGVREVAERLLETLGYAVMEARTVADAMALLKPDGRISLVFSDIVMPGKMSGVDLAKWIRAERNEIKVLLTSGYRTDVAGGTEGGLGDIRVLPKPYTLSQLGRAVQVALAKA
jgi:DNA-binding NtrC family response regulator